MGRFRAGPVGLLVLAGLLSACNFDGSSSVVNGVMSRTNSALAIKGAPAATATANTAYSFVPSATAANSAGLSFTITGKPAWATFNVATGELSGIAQTGTYSGIVIGVSNGKASSTLPAFTLVVAASASTGTGSATLSWSAPSQNTDGSTLDSGALAGYRVYHGLSRQDLTDVRVVNGASTTSYTLEQLGPGTHYFAVSVVTANGIESSLSEIGSKTIM